MKCTSLRAFKKHVTEAAPNHLSPIYLICGKDPYTRSLGVKILLQALPQASIENKTLLEAPRVDLQEITLSLSSPSLFAPFTVVHVQQIHKLRKEVTDTLTTWLEKASFPGCLILSGEPPHRGTKFYKILEKKGIILDIAEQKPWEKERSLIDWVRQKAQKNHKQFLNNTDILFVQQLGADAALIATEWEKLLTYIGDRPAISQEDIATISLSHPNYTAWRFGDALFDQNPTEALAIGKNILHEGTHLLLLLRQLRFQYQKQCQIASLLQKGVHPHDITQEFPFLRGQILEQNLSWAKSHTPQQWLQKLLLIDQTELETKNTTASPEFLLERLIAKL